MKFGWNIKFLFYSATVVATAATTLLPRISTTTVKKETMSNHKEAIKYKSNKTVEYGSQVSLFGHFFVVYTFRNFQTDNKKQLILFDFEICV